MVSIALLLATWSGPFFIIQTGATLITATNKYYESIRSYKEDFLQMKWESSWLSHTKIPTGYIFC